ncbi:MAG: hypothetical protein ABR979_03230 [Halobacteriota archaeon]
MRTKHEATAKSNATGWHSLTARELHAGIFEFNGWGLHDVCAARVLKASGTDHHCYYASKQAAGLPVAGITWAGF